MKVGFYEAEITPPLGLPIPGYFFERIACGVKQNLFAKAVVIENEGVYTAMVCVDALGLPEGLADVVRREVSARTPIDPASILVAATHSHTSVPVDYTKNETYADRVASAIQTVSLRAADAVVLAYQRLREADVYYVCEEVTGISFCRNCLLKNGEYRTNPFDYVDDVVRTAREPRRPFSILFFRDKNGNPIGGISSFALHHDNVGGEEYSSDYSGTLALRLKDVYGSGFVSVFLSGFNGDINNVDFMHKEDLFHATYEKIVGTLFERYVNMVPTAKKMDNTAIAYQMGSVTVEKRKIPDGFVDSVKAVLAGPAPEPTYDEKGNRIDKITDPYCDSQKYAAGDIVLKTYEEDKRKELDLPVQAIKFGDCLFYGLVGEQFSEFAENICDGSPSDKNFTVSMCHFYNTVSYFPTAHMFHPHVYESTYYSARFEPDTGDRMVKRVLELGHEIF
ncbi:MAG: hypothetical protein IJO59_04430 [Clostridia bacterium]|nr:hypothetical protein [Clostridia bacterium]